MNMGTWTYIQPRMAEQLQKAYSGHPASASTATGSLKVHVAEQEKIVEARDLLTFSFIPNPIF